MRSFASWRFVGLLAGVVDIQVASTLALQADFLITSVAVSYTHLTLPTILRV